MKFLMIVIVSLVLGKRLGIADTLLCSVAEAVETERMSPNRNADPKPGDE